MNTIDMKKFFSIIIMIGFMMPMTTHAAISISEVAWMGTSASQYEEWIELYNDGSESISVSGWKFYKAGGTLLYSLSGTVAAGDYYLICRTTTSLTNPMGGSCNETGAFGGSGLNNTSEHLTLKDISGSTIQDIDASGGWPAGESSSKKTMQKSGGEWITAAATPGAEPVETVESPDDTETTNQENHDTASQLGVDSKERIEKIQPDPIYVAHMYLPDYGIAGIAVPFKADVKKDKVLTSLRGKYEWSMGDGSAYVFSKNEPFTHTFTYPGDYSVSLAYYSDPFRKDPDTIHRKTITIAAPSVAIMGSTDDGGVILKNSSDKDIDLHNWTIYSDGFLYAFPARTIIRSESTISISSTVIGFHVSSSASLRNPDKHTISTYPQKIIEPSVMQIAPVDQIPASELGAQVLAPAQSKRSRGNFAQYVWYIALSMIIIIALVAYLWFKLYAPRDEIQSSESEDDDLDYELL